MTRIEYELEIAAPAEQLFGFVADSRNDPRWCPRVRWCEQRGGDGPAPGARYEALHSPTLRRTHTRWIDVLESEPPRRIVTRQEDEVARFTITYTLSPTETGTRIAQRDDIEWKVPRLAQPVARLIVKRHIGDQLRRLKRVAEAGDIAAVPRANRA